MTNEVVQIQFKIYDIPSKIRDRVRDDSGLKLGITGSISELGSWEPSNMLTAEPCGLEENAWTVESCLPKSVMFRWTWLVTDTRDSRVLYSDPAGDRQTILSSFTGTVKATWGLRETCFTSKTSGIKMRIHYHCQPEEVMAIVGSKASLGSWNPKKAIRAKESPANSSNWIAQALLDRSVDMYEWKWVVIDSESGNVKRWEERSNRHIGPECDKLIDTQWNCEGVIQHHGVTVAVNKIVDQDCSNDQTESAAATPAPVNWINNANTTDFPFEVSEQVAAMFKAADRANKPTWRSFIRRLPAVLPFLGLLCNWWN